LPGRVELDPAPARPAPPPQRGASGIPTISHELSTRALPPAQFIDANIRFTVLLRSTARTAGSWPALSATELRVYDSLAAGPQTVAELEPALTRGRGHPD
jgi:ATP-dependent DNA helicase RecG